MTSHNKRQKLDQFEDQENENSEEEESSDDSGGDFDEDDEEGDSDQSGEETEIGADGIVNIDFEGLSPNQDDHDSIKRLLDQLFRGLLVNTSKLSDLVIQMEGFSTVLKDQNNDEPATYAVASAINLSNPLNSAALETAMEFRSNVANRFGQSPSENPQVLQDMKKFEIAGNTDYVFGLLILEKIVNIPEAVAWQMLTTLKEDIEIENGKFTHFFMLTKRYRVGAETFPVEEYFDTLEQSAYFKLDFDLPDNTDTIQHNTGAGKPFRRLLWFKAPALYQAIQTHIPGH